MADASTLPRALEDPTPIFRLREIAARIHAELHGDGEAEIRRITSIELATKGDLIFVSNEQYLDRALRSRASALLISRDLYHACETSAFGDLPVLVVPDARIGFQLVASLYFPYFPRFAPGIHPTALVDGDAVIGDEVHVGPFVTIGAGTRVGRASTIRAGCHISANVEIGEDSYLYPGVVIRSGTRIGKRAVIHPGAVIGSDGYGYVEHEGRHHKVPQVGGVSIGDDVEIGANTCIDRSSFGDTLIGNGVKIDNLVHVAHNVKIGDHALLIAQVGVAGSSEIEERVILAGQVGVSDHLKIGARTIAAAQAGITKDIPPDSKVAGYPAVEFREFARTRNMIGKIPGDRKRVADLEKKVERLERELEGLRDRG